MRKTGTSVHSPLSLVSPLTLRSRQGQSPGMKAARLLWWKRGVRVRSQNHLFLVVWPSAGDFTPLCLSLLIYKQG